MHVRGDVLFGDFRLERETASVARPTMNHPATTGADSPVAPRRRELLAAAAIAAIALLAYLPVMRGGYLWDDYTFLVHNPLIEASDGLHRFWLTTDATDYFPLTSSMLWVEWRLWGNHPAGYHVINVLLHACCAILTWRVLRRLSVPGAWLAGALFAVHPVAAASAAWITEGKNVLATVFYLSSLLAFLKFDEKAGEPARLGPAFAAASAGRDSEIGRLRKREGETRPEAADDRRLDLPISQLPIYLLSVILFLLALLSKTSVVMLPAVLLLCAWWRRGRISRKDLLRSVPFFALSLALGIVTLWFQEHNAMFAGIPRPEGFDSRVAAAGWIAWFYLFKLLLPAGLCVIYPRWNVDGSSALAFFPLLLLLGGMALLWARRKSWGRAPLFALAYFVIMLLPMLGFLDMVIMRLSLVADHLQYAAMIGVIAFAAGALAQAAGAGAWRRPLGALGTAACVGVLGILTWHRASLYSDEKLLWQDNLAKTPTAWAVWATLGEALGREGLHNEAFRCFDKSTALKPDLTEFYYNPGRARAQVKNFTEAIGDYDTEAPLGEDFPKGDLAAACYNRGCAYWRVHAFAKAIQEYDKAISLDKDFAAAYNNRAIAYARMGRLDDALRDFGRAIESNPDFLIACFNRGRALARAGRLSEAVRDFDKALTLKPDFPAAYNNRAIAFYNQKEYDKALADVKRLQALGGRPDPEFLDALTQAAGQAE